MDNGIHFIAGLPRSGSTLLAALLRQNPRFSANMTSPVGVAFQSMLRATSEKVETSVFLDRAQRARLLRACFEAYYADIHPARTVFDTNRLWPTKLSALAQLFPDAKMICCVRNPSWIIDSIERLTRRNAFQLSGMFNFEPGGTVYSRVDTMVAADGILGYATNALREAMFGDHQDRLLLVRYESLVADPLVVLNRIYGFIGAAPFAHDPNRIEEDPTSLEFDRRLGAPGLHSLAPVVQAVSRRTVLPPDVFARFEGGAFWENPDERPAGLQIL